MRLRSFQFHGIRGLPDLKRELAPDGSDLFVVTGPRGSGKTTVLEALIAAKEAAAPYGLADRRWTWLVPVGERSARVELMFELDRFEQELYRAPSPLLEIDSILGEPVGRAPRLPRATVDILGQWSTDPTKGRFAYFPANRALPSSLSPVVITETTPMSLASDNGKFARLGRLVSEGRAREIGAANKLLESAIPWRIESRPRHSSGGSGELELRHRATGAKAVVSHLSSTERQYVLFALAFSDPGFQRSVLFLDMPENDFGELGAADLLNTLMSWGHNQWIVATSSPAIVALAQPRQVLELA